MVIYKNRMFSVILAFYPLLAMYGFGSITFGDIFLIIALLIGEQPDGKRLEGSKTPVNLLWLYMLWCFIGIILNAFRANFLLVAVMKRVIKMGIYLIAITASTKLLDRRQFVRSYRYLVYLTFAVLVVQYLAYYGLGKTIIVKIPVLPYSGVGTEEVIYKHLVSQFRPGALYSEPAACCYVLLPFFSYALFSSKVNRFRVRDIVISGASILMTVSSAGIICCMLLLGIYYINLIITQHVSLKRKLFLLIGSSGLLAGGAWIYSKTPLYVAVERMRRTEENAIVADAVWSKTTAGAEMLTRLTGWTLLSGVGLGNLSMASLSNYSNSINYILYCTGYIGMAILVCWVISVLINTKMAGKATILVFCALCISSRIFISYSIMLYAVFCLIDDKRMDEAEADEYMQENARMYG